MAELDAETLEMVNDLHAVVAVMGLQESFSKPAEVAEKWLADLERLNLENTELKARAEKAEARNSIVWLIEQPETQNMPVRWWHPKTGWMLDAYKACWFVRKKDAEALLNGDRLGLRGIVTEHLFMGRENE